MTITLNTDAVGCRLSGLRRYWHPVRVSYRCAVICLPGYSSASRWRNRSLKGSGRHRFGLVVVVVAMVDPGALLVVSAVEVVVGLFESNVERGTVTVGGGSAMSADSTRQAFNPEIIRSTTTVTRIKVSNSGVSPGRDRVGLPSARLGGL